MDELWTTFDGPSVCRTKLLFRCDPKALRAKPLTSLPLAELAKPSCETTGYFHRQTTVHQLLSETYSTYEHKVEISRI